MTTFNYSTPKYFYQYLHNLIVKVILKTGKLLGYFRILDKQTSVVNYLATIFVCSLIFHQSYIAIRSFVEIKHARDSIVSLILAMMTQISFLAFICISYTTTVIKRKELATLIDSGVILANPLKLLNRCENYEERFIYSLSLKLFAELIVTISATILAFLEFYDEPCISLFLFVFGMPLCFQAYCFINTLYCVAFVYATFLLQKLRQELSHSRHYRSSYIRFLSHHYQHVLIYTKKANKMLQMMILAILCLTFDSSVDQVTKVTSRIGRLIQSPFFIGYRSLFKNHQRFI